MTDFALNVVSKLEGNEEQVGQIEILMNIWKSLITQKNDGTKIKKFVAFLQFYIKISKMIHNLKYHMIKK